MGAEFCIETLKEALSQAGIGKWLAHYNLVRPHSTLGILIANAVYAGETEPVRGEPSHNGGLVCPRTCPFADRIMYASYFSYGRGLRLLLWAEP